MNKSEAVRKLCEEQHIRMIDFKMTDIDGRWRHITIPVERFGEDTFTYGIGFENFPCCACFLFGAACRCAAVDCCGCCDNAVYTDA